MSSILIKAQFGNEKIISTSLEYINDVKNFDLDNDGDIDILISVDGADKISWFENLGDGRFTEIIVDINASNPKIVYASDLDGDGDLDILATITGGFIWYENLGNGNFGIRQTIASGLSNPYFIYSCDIDGDGDMDVIGTITGNDRLVWYENLGGASFSLAKIISNTGDYPRSVFAKDLDGDLDLDLILGSRNDNKVAWYENLGSGLFGTEQIISITTDYVREVYADDLDGDGDMDVLSASSSDKKVVWYENLGGGVIDTSVNIISIGQASYSLCTKDMDNDGDNDVVTNLGYDVVWFERLNSGGIDTVKHVIGSIFGEYVRVSDMDNDGLQDVVLSGYYGGKIMWYKNLGAGVFSTTKYVYIGALDPDWVFTTDLDFDGDQDIISTSIWWGNIVWYENLDGGNFEIQKNLTSDGQVRSVNMIDLDGDLDLDIIAGFKSGGKIAWYENQGNGNFGSQQIFTNSVLSAGLLIQSNDLDSDGDNDVLVGIDSNNDTTIVWFENLGGVVDTSMKFICGLEVNFLHLADSDIDIIASSNSTPRKLLWLENLGGGVIDTNGRLIKNTDGYIHTSDIDVDGDLDVLVAISGKIVWHENLGGGVIDTTEQFIVSSNANSIYTKDIDGDGDQDILLSESIGKISWVENTGNATFGGQAMITTTASGVVSIYPSDLDGDSDLDVIYSSFTKDKIAWYENLLICTPIASFNVVDNGLGNYSFTNTSSGSFSKFHWSYGDGTVDTVSNPNHTFTTNGVFVVVLTVMNRNDSLIEDCFDYYFDTINVTGVPIPLQCVAGFVMYPDAGNVTVINSSTGTNLTYLWDFGDGNTSSQAFPTYTYATSDNYYLCLTIDDGAGCVDMYCDSIGQNGVVFNKQTGFTINVIAPPIVTGLENVSVLNSLVRIYPNPTSTQLTLETKLAIKEVVIIDIAGQIINSIVPKANKIDVSNLSNGIYFIKVVGEEQTIIQKFVKD